MSVNKKGNRWVVDVRPNGAKGKRIIRQFITKAEAIRFESYVISEAVARKNWNPSPKDSRYLSELVALWREEHSVTITNGKKHAKVLERFCKAINDPLANEITSQTISKWRSERLKQIQPSTANTELVIVKGLFNWLRKRKYIEYQNPAADIERIRLQEQERPFLTKEQVSVLVESIPYMNDQRVATLIQTCLETGCRWSEAEGLTRDRIRTDRVIFINTKNKKKRAVPIRVELAKKLSGIASERPFDQCGWTARRYLNQLLDLPTGISTHVLRHTFASHFVMAGGNLVTLQRILGHSKIEMTMRYAHLAPEHLEDALTLNSVNQMERKWKA